METIQITTDTEEPIIIKEPTMRTFVIMKNKKATIISKGKIAITINLQEGANLDYYHITNEEEKNLDVRQEINLLGRKANAHVTNFTYGKNDDKSSINTFIEHAAANTRSMIIGRGILKNKAKNKNTCLITINKQALNAEGHQDMKTIILDDAEAYNIPELAIHNNDVQCSHASSVGQLEQEQLFYLQSRGLTEEEATTTLIKGFYEPLLANINDQALATTLRTLIEERP